MRHEGRRETDLEAFPVLVCPQHGSPLIRREEFIACPVGHEFRVTSGIPRFVPSSTYTNHFGEQWKRYRRTQLDSFTGKPISRNRLRRCIGEELWLRLRYLSVLEAGCGAGRFTEVLCDEGAQVVSIDLSEAVEANAENVPLANRHVIAQADIMAIPFQTRQFDLVLCLGVLQHTPSPESAIAKLYEQVIPGGSLVIDHYAYKLGWYTKTAPLFRAVLKRLSPARALRITEALVDRLLPLHKKVAHSWTRSIVHHLSPVLTHFVTYPELDGDIQRQWALLDTHDSLTDWYKHFRTRRGIYKTLSKMGLENIHCEYSGNGVEARGRRPIAGHSSAIDMK